MSPICLFHGYLSRQYLLTRLIFLPYCYVCNKYHSLIAYISITLFLDAALYTMSEGSRDIYSARGVTPVFWKTLDVLWGSEIAGPLRKLPLVRNHKGPYKQCLNPPIAPEWYKRISNPNIDLLEARYGSIEGISSNKPSIWFVVKHRREQDERKARISEQCHLSICIQWFTKNKKGTEDRESFNSECFPITIVKISTHEEDLYVLLEMILESTDLTKALPYLEAPPSGRIGPGERLVVHLQDSLPGYGHRSAIWQADVNW